MFYPCMSILLSYARWWIGRQYCEESSAFLKLTSAPHTEAACLGDFAGFRGQSLRSRTTTGVTHGLTDRLPAP